MSKAHSLLYARQMNWYNSLWREAEQLEWNERELLGGRTVGHIYRRVLEVRSILLQQRVDEAHEEALCLTSRLHLLRKLTSKEN